MKINLTSCLPSCFTRPKKVPAATMPRADRTGSGTEPQAETEVNLTGSRSRRSTARSISPRGVKSLKTDSPGLSGKPAAPRRPERQEPVSDAGNGWEDPFEGVSALTQRSASRDHGLQLPDRHPLVSRRNQPVHFNMDSTKSSMDEVFSKLEAAAKKGERVALVSGGSMSGLATAMKLHSLGFKILMVEKRKDYSRENVFSLKEEVFFSLASMSPDGELMRRLLDDQLVTLCQKEVHDVAEPKAAATSSWKVVTEPASRFMAWLRPTAGPDGGATLPIRIPRHLSRKPDSAGHLDLEDGAHQRRGEKAMAVTDLAPVPDRAGLDLEMPAHDPVEAVAPPDWRYEDLTSMGLDNLALSQVKDLESGLSRHCSGLPGFYIVRGDFEVEMAQDEDGNVLDREDEPPCSIRLDDGSVFHPDFHTVACLAEGAKSVNRKALGEVETVETEESWSQGNYVNHLPERKVGGFTHIGLDEADRKMTVTQYVEQEKQSLVNISTLVPRDRPLDVADANRRLAQAQPAVDATGADLPVEESARQYDSGRIDIDLVRALRPIRWRYLTVGDASASGSPALGFGASLSLSAYPEAVARLVESDDFRSGDSKKVDHARARFHQHTADISDIRHGAPTAFMKSKGIYGPGTGEAIHRMSVKARYFLDIQRHLEANPETPVSGDGLPGRQDTSEAGSDEGSPGPASAGG
jgi:2-polyprenyl-6-methoxyphenol hydroxylase-like FAD-dependent oxidoreductase